MTMKLQLNKTCGSARGLAGPLRRLVRGALSAGLVLALLAPASRAQISAGGGESVGSLPGTSGAVPGDVDGQVDPGVAGLPFRLVLTGRQSDLRALILQAHRLEGGAPGSWELTPLAVPGLARLTFEGAVELKLDRGILERSFTTFSVELGAPFAGGALQLSAGSLRRTLPIGAQPIDLRLPQLAWSGLVDRGVSLQASTPGALAGVFAAGAARLDITATRDTVRLVQRPVLPR
jgi:hypothetical protein